MIKAYFVRIFFRNLRNEYPSLSQRLHQERAKAGVPAKQSHPVTSKILGVEDVDLMNFVKDVHK